MPSRGLAALILLPCAWAAREWRLTFADEFDGSALNTSTWSVYGPFNNGARNITWTPDAVSVSGGQLRILTSLRWCNRTHMFVTPAPPECRDTYDPAHPILDAWAGQVNTNSYERGDGGGFSQLYGRFDVRARLPAAAGIAPAIFMFPDSDVCWPGGGEIDILEADCTGGQNPHGVPKFLWGSLVYDKVNHSTCHGGFPQCLQCNNRSSRAVHSGYYPCPWHSPGCNPSRSLADEFHTYSVVWTPHYMQWFVDDTMYTNLTSADATIPSQPFYLILQTALNLNPLYHTVFVPSEYPVTLEFDWIRVYQ